MRKLNIELILLILTSLSSPAYGHLCDNIFRRADKLVVKPERDFIRIEKTGALRIFIKNTYPAALHRVRMIGESDAFFVDVEPPLIKELKPQEKTFFTLKLKVKEGVKPGDYSLLIKVGARQFNFRPHLLIRGEVEKPEVTKPSEPKTVQEKVTKPQVKPQPEDTVIQKEPPPTKEEIKKAQVKPPVLEKPFPKKKEIIKPSAEEKVGPANEIEPEEDTLLKGDTLPTTQPIGEVIIRVERFAELKYYLYLIPIVILVVLLIWRRVRYTGSKAKGKMRPR